MPKIVKSYKDWVEYLFDEYQEWWKPWANTVAYYPLNSDTQDYSGNNRHLTGSWTYSWNMITSTSTLYYNWLSLFWQDYGWDFTFSFYADLDVSSSDAAMVMIRDSAARPSVSIGLSWTGWTETVYKWYNQSWSGRYWSSSWNFTKAGTHCFHLVRGWNTVTMYMDWVSKWSISFSWYVWAWNSNSEYWPKFWYAPNSLTTHRTVRIWNVILENKARTAQEITDYYNRSKKNYGL